MSRGIHGSAWVVMGLAACFTAVSATPDESGPALTVAEEGMGMTAAAKQTGWTLVWSDEFDYEGPPDPSRWTYEVGFIRNQELQYYTSNRLENARVENGVLVIEARKGRFRNPAYDPSRSGDWRNREFAEYTSASLTTLDRASWTFGRIEVRAKLPRGRGTWPAIWTLGANIREEGWPLCGEIDIMEFVGFDPDGIYTTVHTAGYNHVKGNGRGRRTVIPNVCDDFHVFAVLWEPKALTFFVDGAQVFEVLDDGTGLESWPFVAPQYLLLNLAVGGTWGGSKGMDENIWPQRLLIDYVRVYQRGNQTQPRRSAVP